MEAALQVPGPDLQIDDLVLDFCGLDHPTTRKIT
jgi:hypothetical protein